MDLYAASMIPSIQVYRGLAALAVALFHAGLITRTYFPYARGTEAFDWGCGGVPFFFVLSGFVILYKNWSQIGAPRSVGDYLGRRALRIYPLYWLTTLALVPVWWTAPQFGHSYHRDLAALSKSLLLWPQPHYPHLAVGWTLNHEMLFYLVFAALIASARLGIAATAGWSLATVVVWATGYALPFPWSFALAPVNLLFVMGMGIAALHCRWPRFPGRWGPALLVAGGGLLLASLMTLNARADEAPPTHLWALGGATAVLLAGVRCPRVESWFAERRVGLLLGDASYAIYLVHYPALSALIKVVALLGWERILPGPALAAALAALAAALGVLVHLVVERPLQRRLGRSLATASCAAASAAAERRAA